MKQDFSNLRELLQMNCLEMKIGEEYSLYKELHHVDKETWNNTDSGRKNK